MSAAARGIQARYSAAAAQGIVLLLFCMVPCKSCASAAAPPTVAPAARQSKPPSPLPPAQSAGTAGAGRHHALACRLGLS